MTVTIRSDPPDIRVTESPYRGLMPYTEADSELFFGRESDISLIANNIRANRFCVLYGPSGVGKSSVLQAGVVQQIRQENRVRSKRFGAAESAVALQKDWRDDPYAAIVAAVRDALSATPGAPELGEPAGDDPVEVIAALRVAVNVDLLLILDQFEEFFLYHRNDAEEFAEFLARLTARGNRINVCVSIRDDALALLNDFEADIPDVLERSLRLEHLDREAAEAAIRRPLDFFNDNVPPERQVGIEDALVVELLRQLRIGQVQVDSAHEAELDGDGEHDQGVVRIEAPYLQLVLTRLWDDEARQATGRLRLESLRELGGAQEIVRQHLDRVMREFTPPELDVLADAFRYLVTPSGSKIAHRPSDLADFGSRDPAQVATLLRRLAEGKLLILREVPAPLDKPHAEPRFEIFHDVLALAVLDWRRRYLAVAMAARQKAAAESEAAQRQAELIAEKERVEQETREAKRRLKRTQLFVAVMTVLALVSVAATVYAWRAVQRANTEAERADRAATLDLVNQLLETDPSLALREAIEKWRPDADDKAFETAFRQAIDSADTQVELRFDSPVVTTLSIDESLVTVTEDGRVQVWQSRDADGAYVVDERPLLDVDAVESGEQRATAAVLAGKQGFVVVTSDDGGIYSVSLEDGAVAQPPSIPEFGDDISVSAASGGGGDLVAVWDSDGRQILWDVTHNSLVSAVGLDDMSIVSAAIDRVEQHLAIVDLPGGDGNPTVVVYSLSDGSKLAEYDLAVLDEDEGASSGEVTFTENDDLVVYASGYRVGVYTWNWVDEEEPVLVDRYFSRVFDVGLVENSSGEERLALAANKTVALYKDKKRDRPWEYDQQTAAGDTFFTHVAVSPTDSQLYAVGTRGGGVEVYRVGPGRLPLRRLLGHDGAITSVAFSADGERLVTSSRDETVRVWRLPKRDMVYQDAGIGITFARTSSDGAYRFALNDHGYLTRIDREGNLDETFDFDLSQEDTDVAYTVFGKPLDMDVAPDGSAVVAADDDCFDATTPRLAQYENRSLDLQEPESEGVFGCVTAVAWSPDANRPVIVAGNDDNQLVEWDAETGAVSHVERLGETSSEVRSVAISRDGSTVVATSGSGLNGVIHVFDLATWEHRSMWEASSVDTVDVSSAGDFVATAGQDRQVVQLWEVDSEESLGSLSPASGTLGPVAFSPDDHSSRIVVGTSQGLVYVWDRRTQQLLSVMRSHAQFAQTAVFDPELEDTLLSGGDDGELVSIECGLCSVGSDDLLKAAEQRVAQVVDVGH